MTLIRLSGHSGAGKSRLLAALAKRQFKFRRPIMYTSRMPRTGEVHGRDYYFMSRGFIKGLSPDRFVVGDVREAVHAVDLVQLEFDIRSGDPVILEIYHTRWQRVKEQMGKVFGPELRIVSVFLTAIPPASLTSLPPETAATEIRDQITRNLTWRGKDSPDKIRTRAESAVAEITGALTIPPAYDRVFLSAPEGPDGEDDWTSGPEPRGQAAQVLGDFLEFVGTLS